MLVNKAGKYRIERVFYAKTEVFQGELSPSDLENFRQRLDSDDLRTLTQSRIPTVLITNAPDSLTIAVFRNEGLQKIVFPTSESRQSFRATLDPLLKWLEIVQKGQHTRLAESTANRCLPDGVAVPVATSTVPGSGPAHNSAQYDYLVKMTSDHASPLGAIERTCIVVGSSGRYHMEKTTQTQDHPPEAHIFEDSVSQADLQALRNLLEDPELVKQVTQNVSRIPPSQEFDLTTFFIPRLQSLQRLRFTSFFNVQAPMSEPGGMGNMRYGTEQNTKTLRPLREWMRINIEKRRLNPLNDAQPNGCELTH